MPFDNFGNFVPYGNYPQQPAYASKQAPQNVYAFVNGIEGAKSYIVPANQTVLLMDSEQPVCYMKTANALGQGSLRYFKLSEVTEADIRQTTTKPVEQPISLDNIDDFVQLKERVSKLEKKLGAHLS